MTSEGQLSTFRAPMINLYSRDLPRAVAFYSEMGFVETFRTPASGEPVHVELKLDGFTLGIATIEAAREYHGLRPEGEGRWIEIVVWTDDTDSALSALVAKGTYYRKLWIRCGNEKGGVPFRVGNANPGGSRVEGDATDVEGSREWSWKGSRRAAF